MIIFVSVYSSIVYRWRGKVVLNISGDEETIDANDVDDGSRVLEGPGLGGQVV